MCIQETWLSKNDNYGNVKLKGYECIIYLNEKFDYTTNPNFSKSGKVNL